MKNKKHKKYDRNLTLLMVMFILFGIILYRLFYLQINQGSYYSSLVQSSTAQIANYAPRGNITDSNDEVLATSVKSYNLMYTETKDNKSTFYTSILTAYKILDEEKELSTDDFVLKVNPLHFEFKSSDPAVLKKLEISFKRIRGLNTAIEINLYPDEKPSALSSKEKDKVDAELLKLTPEDTFAYLVKLYDLGSLIKVSSYTKAAINSMGGDEILKILLKNYSMAQLRRFIVIKDALSIQGASTPVTIKSNISKNTAFILEQRQNEMPGVSVEMEPIRYYPNNDLGSAFLGYVARINSDNQEAYEEKGYDVNTDFIGITGIESSFEKYLRGSKGESIVKLDNLGTIVEELGSKNPYPGDNIQLTINKNVQIAAERGLDSLIASLQVNRHVTRDTDSGNATRGAAVAIEIGTGKVLAIASRPGYDPNVFTSSGGLSTALVNTLFTPDLTKFGLDYIRKMGLVGKNNSTEQALLDKLFPLDATGKQRGDPYNIYAKPLLDYATSFIPPGSTFKLLTAMAGLETGVITTSTTVLDQARFDDGRHFTPKFPNDAPNGYVSLVRALALSSNPYFMTVGMYLRDTTKDENILAKFAWRFGLGADPASKTVPSTGIEIPESFGQVYNKTSGLNSYAQSYLWVAMANLLHGTSSFGGSFKPIDLNFRASDSTDVKALKTKIRDNIKQTVKTGNRDTTSYINLLTQLITADSSYKDKNYTKTDINMAVGEILWQAIDEGNSQANSGANIYNASIGQGMDAFTPVQLANYVATIADGGSRYNLSLINKITDPDGKVIQEFKPEIVENTGVSASTIAAVKQGMEAVNDIGTAAGAFKNLPFKTAGKTGTATFSPDQDLLGRTAYAVYVGYAPADNPKIAVCVAIYDGGYGSFVAPIARAMYEAYYKDTLKATPGFVLPPEDSYLQDMFK